MALRIVYKVVHVDRSGALRSMIAFGKACVAYPPGKWVFTPKWLAQRGYYLTAYETLDAAKWASKMHPQTQIWEALGIVVNAPLPEPLDPTNLAVGILILTPEVPWAKGTVMCKALQLTQRLA